MYRGATRAGRLVLLMLTLSACPSLPELEWQGEHIRFGAEDPEKVCGGTLAYLDARAGQLGARFNTNHAIDYYWLPTSVDAFCPDVDHLVGCVMGDEVFSEWVPHEHELVHATATDMPRVFDEGLATHWGDPWPIYEMAPRARLYESIMGGADITGPDEYARSGHFMAYLSEAHGPESLVELDRVLTADSSTSAINQAFLDIYGGSLAEVWADYDQYPDCDGIVDVSLSCATEPTLLSFANPEIVREIDCSSSEAIGPYDGMAFVEEVVELEPSVSGSRIVQVTGDGAAKGGVVMIRRCGPCTDNGVGAGNSLAFLDDEDLPAGRYVIRFYLPIEQSPATLGLQISG